MALNLTTMVFNNAPEITQGTATILILFPTQSINPPAYAKMFIKIGSSGAKSKYSKIFKQKITMIIAISAVLNLKHDFLFSNIQTIVVMIGNINAPNKIK